VETDELRLKLGDCLEQWIVNEYRNQLTCYHIIGAVKKWLQEHGAEGSSVCEVLMQPPFEWEGVGDAKWFVSHVQSEHPKNTLLTMQEHCDDCQWVDIFSLRQWQKDFEPGEIHKLIKEIGSTVSVIDAQKTYTKKIFCIFEAYSAAEEEGSTFEVLIQQEGCTRGRCMAYCCGCWCCPGLYGNQFKVKSREATTRDNVEERKIKRFIQSNAGFERVDKCLEERLSKDAEDRAGDGWATVLVAPLSVPVNLLFAPSESAICNGVFTCLDYWRILRW